MRAVIGLVMTLFGACVAEPALEHVSDGGNDLQATAQALLGAASASCFTPAGVPEPCGPTTDLQHTALLTRLALRSAAFLECMDRSVRVGVPFVDGNGATLDTVMKPVTDQSACYGEPAGEYSYTQWGPYVSCRPWAELAWGGTTATGLLNHDGAWDELIDRQIARAFTALQQDIKWNARFTSHPMGSGQVQFGYSAASNTAAVEYRFALPGPTPLDSSFRVGGPGDDWGWVTTFTHEYLHDLGYDHGCGAGNHHPVTNTDHGNCGRRPGRNAFVGWHPTSAMNNIAAFCAKEVLRRSMNVAGATQHTGCGLNATASDLTTCQENGRMLISRFAPLLATQVACHCVPDSIHSSGGFGANEPGTRFGSSMTVADFDGDGFQDLVVGASGLSSQGNLANTGAYLFRGSVQGLRPWRSFEPADLGITTNGSECGRAVAAGDFNNDGVPDLAVGCPHASTRGRVVVLRGCRTGCTDGVGPQQSQRVILSPGSTHMGFGSALAVGRFSGDSVDDLAIGCPQSVRASVASGAVRVFRGDTTSMLVSHSTVAPPVPQASQLFGTALAFGNIQGSTDVELLVGAPGTDGSRGAAFVVRGPTGSAAGDVTQLSVSAASVIGGAQFGAAVTTALLYGNDFAEAVVGAPGIGSLLTARGGSAGAAPATLALASGLVQFGASIAAIPGGAGEFLVGAPGHFEGRVTQVKFGSGQSTATLVGGFSTEQWSANDDPGTDGSGNCPIFGDIDHDTFCPIDQQNPPTEALLGTAVAVGNFGQGLQFVGGAPFVSSDEHDTNRTGAVYVRAGAATAQEYRFDRVSMAYGGSPLLPRRFGTTETWNTSLCLASEECRLGDVDNDGDDDAVIFSRSATAGKEGDVFVAKSNGASSFGVPGKVHDWFCVGNEQCEVADVNGDGRADLVAFERGSTGGVWVALAPTSSSPDPAPFGPGQKRHSFFCVFQQNCALGDVTGDGRADLVAFDQGSVADVWMAPYVGPGFGPAEKWHDNMCSGTQPCRLGDVDGDGDDDVVAFNANSSDARVFVAFSTRTQFEVWVQTWHLSFCSAGMDCQLGDINGDGFADAIAFNRATGAISAALSNGRDFGPPSSWKTSLCTGNQVCALADTQQADDRADVVVFNHTSANSQARVAVSGR